MQPTRKLAADLGVKRRNQERRSAMPYRKDKVSDVVAILAIMRDEFNSRSSYYNCTELRKEAVKGLSENKLRQNRFKNQDSAEKSIHDACARRLKPDVGSIKDFDRLADQWLRQNSMRLKDILLKHSESSSQRSMVADFFRDKI